MEQELLNHLDRRRSSKSLQLQHQPDFTKCILRARRDSQIAYASSKMSFNNPRIPSEPFSSHSANLSIATATPLPAPPLPSLPNQELFDSLEEQFSCVPLRPQSQMEQRISPLKRRIKLMNPPHPKQEQQPDSKFEQSSSTIIDSIFKNSMISSCLTSAAKISSQPTIQPESAPSSRLVSLPISVLSVQLPRYNNQFSSLPKRPKQFRSRLNPAGAGAGTVPAVGISTPTTTTTTVVVEGGGGIGSDRTTASTSTSSQASVPFYFDIEQHNNINNSMNNQYNNVESAPAAAAGKNWIQNTKQFAHAQLQNLIQESKQKPAGKQTTTQVLFSRVSATQQFQQSILFKPQNNQKIIAGNDKIDSADLHAAESDINYKMSTPSIPIRDYKHKSQSVYEPSESQMNFNIDVSLNPAGTIFNVAVPQIKIHNRKQQMNVLNFDRRQSACNFVNSITPQIEKTPRKELNLDLNGRKIIKNIDPTKKQKILESLFQKNIRRTENPFKLMPFIA